MPKSSKRFILSTSQLNCYGFRLLTEGADLADFKNNPVMLWMHMRAWKGTKDEVLPLGYWDDLKIEGDEISGVPFFDDNDAFAMSIYHKVENGTLRTCSSGAVPLAFSEEEKYLVPGQTRATVTKWKMKEASITDIPGNPGALAVALYDQDNNLIKLSDNSSLNNLLPEINLNSKMKQIQLSAPALAAKLSLTENATDVEFLTAIDNLVKLNGDLVTEKQNLTTLNGELTTKVTDLETAAKTKDIEIYLSQAETARKITKGQIPHYTALALVNFEHVKNLIDAMPATPTVTATLAANTGKSGEDLADKTWDELHQGGKLEKLKADNPEMFKLKYKEKFGREPKN